jgi:hypothetical protein
MKGLSTVGNISRSVKHRLSCTKYHQVQNYFPILRRHNCDNQLWLLSIGQFSSSIKILFHAIISVLDRIFMANRLAELNKLSQHLPDRSIWLAQSRVVLKSPVSQHPFKRFQIKCCPNQLSWATTGRLIPGTRPCILNILNREDYIRIRCYCLDRRGRCKDLAVVLLQLKGL